MMKSVRKYDIWFANLSEINIRNGYVIIVSNWKNNTKSNSVNVCTLTTKDKLHPAHIKIINLDKEVTICCENIYTIKKDCLICKSGTVNEVDKQVEIDRALSMQLQVDNKYNINTPEEMEEFFLGSKVDDISNIKELSNEIYSVDVDEFPSRKLELAEELINVLSKSSIESKNEYMWFAKYTKALAFYKLNEFKKSIEEGRESFKFLSKKLDSHYSLTMFLLASCYEKTDKYRAVDIYVKLASYYKNTNEINMRIASIFDMAKVLENRKAKLKLIKYVENIKEDYRGISDISKEQLLIEMYKDL